MIGTREVGRVLLSMPMPTGVFMAKDQNTLAKRRREMEKKRKAEAKRERRRRKKEQADDPTETAAANAAEDATAEQ